METTIVGESRRMVDLTKKDLQDVIRECLVDQNAVGGEQHHHDHEFIQLLKDREQRRVDRVEKFKSSLIGGVAISLIGGLIWIGQWAAAHLSWGN